MSIHSSTRSDTIIHSDMAYITGTGEMAGGWASSKDELTDEDIVRANEIGELL